MAQLIDYLKEVQVEAKKVNWPTRNQTLVNTFLVLLFSVVVAALLGVFDALFLKILGVFIV